MAVRRLRMAGAESQSWQSILQASSLHHEFRFQAIFLPLRIAGQRRAKKGEGIAIYGEAACPLA